MRLARPPTLRVSSIMRSHMVRAFRHWLADASPSAPEIEREIACTLALLREAVAQHDARRATRQAIEIAERSARAAG